RAAKLEEGLEIVDGLWRGTAVHHLGEHYRVEELRLLPRPLQEPRVTIWLAAGWPRRRPLRRAAAWDGVYLMTVNQTTGRRLTPSDVREAAAFVQGVRRRQDPFDIAVNVSIGEDPDPM